MKFNKLIAKGLALGILLNSISINSFANILSENERYETFKGNDITINNVLEEDKVDVKIEGNTLVNLNNSNNYRLEISNQNSIGNLDVTMDDKYLHVTTNGDLYNGSSNYLYVGLGKPNLKMLKPNTTYTVIGDIIKGIDKIAIVEGNNTNRLTKEFVEVTNNKAVITTKSSISPITNQIIYGYIDNYRAKPIDIEIKNIMLIEGDWSNKEVPSYFNEMQSSFENELITQELIDSGEEDVKNLGKYKTEFKTIGKNLFNGELEPGYYDIDNGLEVNYHHNLRSKGYIKTGDSFSISTYGIEGDLWILNYDENFNYLGYSYNNNTIKNNTEYIKFYFVNPTINNEALVQVEKGPIVTEYEPYKESVSTFYLNSPLLKGDTIEYINGQAYHVRKSDKVILDGNETWNNIGIQGDEGSFIRFSNSNINGVKPKTILISNKFKSEKYTSVSQLTKEFIFSHHSDINRIDILIEVSRLSEATTEGFKSWLKNNPVTVVYELVEPIIEPIKADLSVQLFEGATHISNNSTIPSNMKITVDRTLNRAVEAIELAKTNPTISNLSKARYWNNLLKDSIKKEQLQEEINNITNISDMELEIKNVTSNLDVYIKSENILQMSLDTNSISFEDFSGIEDVIKENAVNITINSSLPYKINAYLPLEIQNADNTKTMDLSILNIKENSESNYQTFSNTTDKIVLKDNCSAGNQLTHGVDLKLAGGIAHEKDVYKATIKLEAEQK